MPSGAWKKSQQTKTAKWMAAIRAAMAEVDGLTCDETVRSTISRCLMAELVAATERLDGYVSTENDGAKWEKSDLDDLRAVLTGRVAMSWSEERMNVTEAALRVRRSEKIVRKKAIELGLARAVDYWMNTQK